MSSDPLWYKNAVIYQAHIKAYCDGNGDGTGDFKGLISKLDYLQELGITAIWLLPFYPSPLRDDGYDIADYRTIHPRYGTMADFKRFLAEAHRRGLRVITELVLNHTSDQHPWFQRARRARPGSVERDFYVWNDTPDKYKETRIIFKDFEPSNWTWDPIAKAYYWHRFYRHQPDLNFDNPAVGREMFRIIDFWLEMGVDGFRLDAVPYLYEREGTHCENLPQVHEFLKKLRAYVDRRYPNRMLLAEANQWPEDARAYFGYGDECQMAFHFPLMPRLFMALRMEDRFPVVDILDQTPPIPANCQWAIFLRNHDELTLEMVTEEDRDYLWRVYAEDKRARINLGIRRRLAPLLENDRNKIDLMNGLLFSLPGSPVIYYGDEIGMGDNLRLPDRDGVRTPMQWNSGKNAGFSEAEASSLYLPVVSSALFGPKVCNVEAQETQRHSLLWQMRRLIEIRKRYPVFGEGAMELLPSDNPKVLSFVRQSRGQRVLVVANLSRFSQPVSLDLSRWAGQVPTELFGETPFPEIGKAPYSIMLNPHAFYWFSLQSREASSPRKEGAYTPPVLKIRGGWESLLFPEGQWRLEAVLPAYLRSQRWFRSRTRRIRSATIRESCPIQAGAVKAHLVFLEILYFDGEPELYQIILTASKNKKGAIAHLKSEGEEWLENAWLTDAVGEKSFCSAWFGFLQTEKSFKGSGGRLETALTDRLRTEVTLRRFQPQETYPSKSDQSNSSVRYGDRWMFKFFRRLEVGSNPDIEIRRYLEKTPAFSAFPRVAGEATYRARNGSRMVLGVLDQFVRNEGDGWQHATETVGLYFDQVLTRFPRKPQARIPEGFYLDWVDQPVPALARNLIGSYLDVAALLGLRSAQMHLALGARSDNPAFAPEPFGELYQKSLHQQMRSNASQAWALLVRNRALFPRELLPVVRRLIGRRSELFRIFSPLLKEKISGMRIRCHGDFHLGQVLYTGKDFQFIDFEGEPARPLSERRIKRSPLKDLAGMIRSFDYAAYAALYRGGVGSPVRRADFARLETWARYWSFWVSVVYLKAYLKACEGSPILPKKRKEIEVLLKAYLLDKAFYELAYEMNNRPDWVEIPLRGISKLLKE